MKIPLGKDILGLLGTVANISYYSTTAGISWSHICSHSRLLHLFISYTDISYHVGISFYNTTTQTI